MDLSLSPFDLILCILGSFGITYGLVSGYKKGVVINQVQINQDIASGKQAAKKIVEEFYGQHSGFHGPLGLYTLFRRTLDRDSLPSWIRAGASCRICVNLTTGGFCVVLAVMNYWLSDILLYTLAAHGGVNMIFGYVRSHKGILPNDW